MRLPLVLRSGVVISCTGGCKGYELMESLDFEDAASYATSSRNLAWVDPDNGGTTAQKAGFR